MIPVTKPFLPSKKKYDAYLKSIWKRNWLTNSGPLITSLEKKLTDYLGVDSTLVVNNGTIALQIAIKALDLRGEIITTPFSYVATTSSIVWEGIKPVFVDIDEATLNIDPEKIEAAITSETTAILATHVYGNVCDIPAISAIAKKHNLKVIYDAAHCFGSRYAGKSAFTYGDVSTVSFHATKLYHSVEGGAVFSTDPEVMHTMSYMRNFGHKGADDFWGVGINGKNSEFHAAMGLCNLEYVADILAKRAADHRLYDDALKTIAVRKPTVIEGAEPNHSYYPIVFEDAALCEYVFTRLKGYDVFARRYFYPTLSTLPYVDAATTPVANDVAGKVLCLPLYYQITEEEINFVAKLIRGFVREFSA